MRRACGRALAAIAVLVCFAGACAAQAEQADWFDQRTEIRAEVTASATAETLFNPGGKVIAAPAINSRLRPRSELTLRLPADIGLKAIAAFQLMNASGARAQVDLTLLEGYLRRPIGRAELSVGRKILRWTNGYAFAPGGLLDPARDPSDPQDRLGLLEGRDLVQLDVYAGAHTFTAVYAPGEVLPTGNADQEELLAFRYQTVVKGIDLSLMAARRFDSVDQAAVSVSRVLGPALEVHAEALVSRGSALPLPRSSQPRGERTLYGPDFYAPLRLHNGREYVRWLLGFNYTLPTGTNVIVEYFHAQDGLGSEEWGRVFDHGQFSRRLYAGGTYPPISDGRSLPELNLLMPQRSLGTGSLGRHYGFLRIAQARAASPLQFGALAFVNLQDGSLVVIPDVSLDVHRRTTIYGRATFPLGSERSEFGNVPVSRAVNIGTRIAF
jgi:hypothetical protein